MKTKQIIGALLMVIFTICLLVINIILPIVINVNSKGILNTIKNSSFIEQTDESAKKVLMNYLTEEKAQTILEKVNVKSQIQKLASAFDNNTINQTADEIKENVKQEIINVLEDDVDSSTKNSFATTISNEYIKALFPVTEFNMLSGIYNKFSAKLILTLVIISIISIAIYTYLALGKKTYKWAIISLYNAIIITVIILISLNVLNDIVIGNERTTTLIMDMLDNIKECMIIETTLMAVIAAISNYFAYFKHRKHSR